MSLSKKEKETWLGIDKNSEKNVQCSSWYKPPTLRWLPQANTNLFPKTSDSDEGLFTRVRNRSLNTVAQLGLLELSLPPFLAPKYHQMSVAKFTAKNEVKGFVLNEKYFTNSIWYINYCDTFGLGYLHELHKKHIALMHSKNTNKKGIEKKQLDLLCMLKNLGRCTSHDSVPEVSECAKNSKDFLQEPSIIIQLPWNTVLFHQWLVAALIEVLTFEKHTLELRHWPLPPQVEPVATQLLLLVKHLKEKIYLGFLILCHQVIDYPTVNTNHPTWILDNVVLPSLARLQFINPSTGKGHDILKSIKKLSWAESETSTGRIYCAPEVYKIPFGLELAFGSSFYSPIFWFDSSIGLYEITSIIKIIDISIVIDKELDSKEHNATFPPGNYVNKEPSLLESGLQNKLQENLSSGTEKTEKVIEVFAAIKKYAFAMGRLPANKYKDLMDIVKNDMKLVVQNLTKKNILDQDDILMSILFHGMFQLNFKKYLVEFEKEKSILPQIILLQYQIAECEQVIRVTNLVAHKLGITPKVITVKNYTAAPMEVSAMLKCMLEVVERDRDWLWSQFPAQWRQPVTLTQPDINMDMPVDKIVKTCEDRIGRIIINAAQTCFDVYQKGGEIFPYWKTVQDIMPCYVAMFVTLLKIEESISSVNYLKIIEELLKHYENAYHTWITNVTPREITNTKSTSKKEILRDTMEVADELCHYIKLNNSLFISYVNPSCEIKYHNVYIYSMKLPMLDWLNNLQNTDDEPLYIEHEYLKIWMLKSLTFVKDLYNVCVKSWQYPNQINLLAINNFKQLYETNEIIMYIDRSLCTVESYVYRMDLLEPCIVKIKKEIELKDIELYEWRWKFHSMLSNTTEQHTAKSIADVFESGKIILQKMFDLYKQYRQVIDKIDVPNLEYVPEMNENHKKVKDLFLKSNFDTLETMLPLLQFKSNEDSGLNCTTLTKYPLEGGKKLAANIISKSENLLTTNDTSMPPRKEKKQTNTNMLKTYNHASTSKSEASTSSKPPKDEIKQTTAKMVKTDNQASSSKNMASASNSGSSAKAKTSVKMSEEKRNKCRNCLKKEKRAGRFLICEACVKDNYPDVNYFCSVKCKEEWWGKEHKAEHLELELGLLDLDSLKL